MDEEKKMNLKKFINYLLKIRILFILISTEVIPSTIFSINKFGLTNLTYNILLYYNYERTFTKTLIPF